MAGQPRTVGFGLLILFGFMGVITFSLAVSGNDQLYPTFAGVTSLTIFLVAAATPWLGYHFIEGGALRMAVGAFSVVFLTCVTVDVGQNHLGLKTSNGALIGFTVGWYLAALGFLTANSSSYRSFFGR